jgi:glycine/D-amino acid oxidase-like deaminating enzyme
MAPLRPRSLWLDTCGDDLTPRAPLAGDTRADVAIVGAGFTGLWTAHHLLAADPSLRVVVLEREIAGWGASGRNGGWCSGLYPVPTSEPMLAALRQTVDDVGEFCHRYDVDAQFVKGGTLTLARGRAQVAALPDDEQRLTAAEATARIAATGVAAASYTPHCAALHPGRLVRGLARVVEMQGATIHELSAVTGIGTGCLHTRRGVVTAPVVLRATEGYTPELPGAHRQLAPIRSLVVATAPLPDRMWQRVGWSGRETLTDGRHLLIYAQRTADDRIVIGGRGAPYRFGSRTHGTSGYAGTHRRLVTTLRELLPQVGDVEITHRWGGVLGVPRDWSPAVCFERGTGLGWAGGYVGDGVAASYLAGATLADLVLGRQTSRTALPWVGHRWRQWEPEPLRWLGIQGSTTAMGIADKREARSGKPSRLAAVVDRVTRPTAARHR